MATSHVRSLELPVVPSRCLACGHESCTRDRCTCSCLKVALVVADCARAIARADRFEGLILSTLGEGESSFPPRPEGKSEPYYWRHWLRAQYDSVRAEKFAESG